MTVALLRNLRCRIAILAIRFRAEKRSFFIVGVILACTSTVANAQIAFDQKQLDFNGNGSISSATSLQFGPDGNLYVSQVNGVVKVFTIVRDDPSGVYQVTAEQTILNVQSIQNHDDDTGSDNNGVTTRQTTGLVVGGTAGAVEVYVSSSDSRIGGGGGGGDANLDTNSGVITRLTPNGSSWDAVDIVRGLSRSEENHATNGLELVTIASRDDDANMTPDRFLIVSSGGHTNAGSPSNNFAFHTEYALSAAVLAVNLDVLESIGVSTDAGGRDFIYDLPTLDDPTRANVNGIVDINAAGYDGIDVNDPFGGNDGLNQAKQVLGGPVQIFSPGYRNTYDLVVTASGAVYVTDNGANGGWGGYPEGEATAGVTNNYRSGEPGSSSTDTANSESQVNNKDHLNLVTVDIQSYVFGSTYGGHPAPVRANLSAGLYARGSHTVDPGDIDSDGQTDGYFRTIPFDPNGSAEAADAGLALPADWPPVPASLINIENADFRMPDSNNPDSANPAFAPFVDPEDDITVTAWQNNTNGIDEYTASNFGGALQGALIAGKNGGSAHIVNLLPNGQLDTLQENFFTGLGGNALGITAQGDTDIFPGSVWIATFNSNIVILEPNDFVICILPGDAGYDPSADNDFDGYTNQDEIDNGTDICSGASQPNDFDDDKVSDLNDLDDDGDGTDDNADSSQLGNPLNLNYLNELFSDQLGTDGKPIGYLGLGLTGFMNNGDANPNWLNWIDRTDLGTGPNDILGGAIGAVTIQQTGGTAKEANNSQEKAHQYTTNVSIATGPFVVQSRMSGFNEAGQIYAFTIDGGDAPPTQGIQIGTGFQDNYIEFILTQAGLTLREEVSDATAEQIDVVIAVGSRPQGSDGEVILTLLVDPTTGVVEGQYAIDGAAPISIGSITAEGLLLNAIQLSTSPLAVGLIGTSGSPQTADPNDDKEFAASWDTLFISGSAPTVAMSLPDLDRQTDAPNDVVDLDNFFADDNGTAALVYSVEGNTDPSIGAGIVGNTLTLSYPSTPATTIITIRATDGDGLWTEQQFMLTVSDQPVPIVRINAGGALVAATDGGPDWAANTATGATSGTGYSVNTGNISTQNIPSSTGRHASIPGSISDAQFDALFANERWDTGAAPEMLWSIPVANGNYEVRLYMGNGFAGTSAAGQRVFNVNIEGGVLEIDGLDLSATYGHQVGAMMSFAAVVGDGLLDIEFFHNVENPLVNAIEILSLNGGSVPITATPIANQTSFEGFTVLLPVQASGGLGALTYVATGLPTGLAISNTTGLITGTIATGAETLSPFSAVVTIDDADGSAANAETVSFTWDVSQAPLPGDVLFRVNAGGALLPDPMGAWSADQSVANAGGTAVVGIPSAFVSLGGGTVDKTYGAAVTGSNTTAAPDALFSTERFNDIAGTTDNMQWDFPVAAGDYVVNLYFAEIFTGTNTVGARVFDVLIEDQLMINDLDQVSQYGFGNAGMETFAVTVSDDNLDIDFLQGIENPSIKGIEILSAQPAANPDAAAFVAIDTGVSIDASTFGGDFVITNNSSNGLEIVSVTFDLGAAIFPDMVFDPIGTAGDATAKCLESTEGAALTGLTTDDSQPASCIDPFSDPHGNGGFDKITVQFNDFDPGETYKFAVDVDPTSIEGVASSGGTGSVSGLELAGAVAIVSFSDGSTTLMSEMYRVQPDSNGSSSNNVLPDPVLAAPVLSISGAILGNALPGAQEATVPLLTPTATVTGAVGANVSLLVLQGDRTVAIADPFVANSVIGVTEIDAVIGGGGSVDIPLLLTDGGVDELNYIAAVIVQSDGRTTNLSTVWRVNFDPGAVATRTALIQVNPGGNIDASTFGTGSFIVDNMGADNIVSVTFDLTGGFLPDVVFDPNGTAGDSGAKCLTPDSGAAATGFVVPTDPCIDPFADPHNGFDGDEGFDSLTISFTDFGPGEVFTFSTDNDPTSIKNDVTTGDAGAISGFELIGTSVTVNFASGATHTASLFDESSLGGSMAIVEPGVPAIPSLALVGHVTPIALPNANQTVLVTGTPGAVVVLLQVDARLFIDSGGGGYDIDPFEANAAMSKVVTNVLIEGDGDTEVPVTLLATTSTDAGPDGGINHFIAVEEGLTAVKSLSSNVLVVELDPTVVIGGTLDGTMLLQGRVDGSSDVEVTLFDLGGVQVGSPTTASMDASGNFLVPGITPGMYQVAVKHPKYLQRVQTVDIVAGSTANDFSEARAGDANDDNFVTLVDFSVLASTFNLASGNPGYNDAADFNGDGVVSLVDFSLLASNFNTAGEVPSP